MVTCLRSTGTRWSCCAEHHCLSSGNTWVARNALSYTNRRRQHIWMVYTGGGAPLIITDQLHNGQVKALGRNWWVAAAVRAVAVYKGLSVVHLCEVFVYGCNVDVQRVPVSGLRFLSAMTVVRLFQIRLDCRPNRSSCRREREMVRFVTRGGSGRRFRMDEA